MKINKSGFNAAQSGMAMTEYVIILSVLLGITALSFNHDLGLKILKGFNETFQCMVFVISMP